MSVPRRGNQRKGKPKAKKKKSGGKGRKHGGGKTRPDTGAASERASRVQDEEELKRRRAAMAAARVRDDEGVLPRAGFPATMNVHSPEPPRLPEPLFVLPDDVSGELREVHEDIFGEGSRVDLAIRLAVATLLEHGEALERDGYTEHALHHDPWRTMEVLRAAGLPPSPSVRDSQDATCPPGCHEARNVLEAAWILHQTFDGQTPIDRVLRCSGDFRDEVVRAGALLEAIRHGDNWARRGHKDKRREHLARTGKRVRAKAEREEDDPGILERARSVREQYPNLGRTQFFNQVATSCRVRIPRVRELLREQRPDLIPPDKRRRRRKKT